MSAKSFTCPKCGKSASIKDIQANEYGCLNPRCPLRERLLVHGEIGVNGRVTKHYGWVLESGTMLNQRYLIEKLLGKGGFGATYLARDKKMFDKLCAIKEIPNVYFDEKEEVFLTFLDHPAIPKLIERFNIQLLHYSVMEYVEGKGLDELIKGTKGGLPEKKVLQLAEEIGNVLNYIHSKKVIHRDLKPENILVRNDNSIVLIDFGIAKQYDLGKGTRRLARAASSYYSSPEQYQAGKGYTDIKSDIYSYGAILYYLLTGREPVDALSRDPERDIDPLPRKLNPKISSQVEKAIVKALKMRKQDRFTSVQQMNRMLLGKTNKAPGICPKCGVTLQIPGNFCPNCGHSTNQLVKSKTEAFIFRSGDTALTVQQFIQLCYQRWEDAKWHLVRGDFIEWLEKQEEKALARKARQSKKRKTDPDILLNEFLETSRFGVPPQLAISQNKFNFKEIHHGESKEATLVIANTGKGLLKGKIKTSARWIRSDSTEFCCTEGERLQVKLTIDTQKLTISKSYREHLLIQSNAKQVEIPISFTITEAPARPEITPSKIFLQVKPGKSTSTSIMMKNVGSAAALTWRLVPTQEWIQLKSRSFKANTKKVDIAISALHLKAGHYTGNIQINSSLGQALVQVDLVVSPTAKNGSWRTKSWGQVIRDTSQSILFLLILAFLISHFGDKAVAQWGEPWLVAIFAALGGYIGIRKGFIGLVSGIVIGGLLGLVSPYALFYAFHFVENKLIQPSYLLLHVKYSPCSALSSWGVLGVFLGGMIGLVRGCVGMRQLWSYFLLCLSGFMIVTSILFVVLAYIFSGQ